jgi:hypothetical protein
MPIIEVKHDCIKRPRSGSAPLEFVLVLPVLLMTGMLLLYVARVSIVTVSDAAAARQAGWRDRLSAPQPNMLQTGADPMFSSVEGSVRSDHPRWTGISAALPNQLSSQSSTTVVAGTWGASNISAWNTVPEYWAPHGTLALLTRVITQTDLNWFGTANTSKLNPAIVGGSLAVQKDWNSIQIVLGQASGGGSVAGAKNLLGTLGLVVDSLYLATIGLERKP